MNLLPPRTIQPIRIWIDRLRDSFWFIPGLLTAAAAVLGLVMPYVDQVFEPSNGTAVFLYDVGAEGARSVLTTAAASSIGIAATVFSITIATLTLTSSQFGPRLLRTFTSDRGIQVALGMFLATFVYPLLVLRTVRTSESLQTGGMKHSGEPDDAAASTVSAFVPHLSVMLALLLALFAVAVLIYFIHHVSRIIRAPQVIDAVGLELDETADDVLGSLPWDGEAEIDPPARPDPAAVIARASRSGFLAVIDEPELSKLADAVEGTLWCAVRPGDYLFEGTPLVIAEADIAGRVHAKAARRVEDAFRIRSARTVTGDVGFAIDQLTEIAQRALSPGINDPFTAQSCTDRLAASLARVASRMMPSPEVVGRDGPGRLICFRPTWPEMVQRAFAPIRRWGGSDAAVESHILDALRRLSAATPKARREPLRVQANAARAAALAESPDEPDKAMVEAAHAACLQAIRDDAEPPRLIEA